MTNTKDTPETKEEIYYVEVDKAVVEEATEVKFEDWDEGEYAALDEFASDDLYLAHPELRGCGIETEREEKQDCFLYTFSVFYRP